MRRKQSNRESARRSRLRKQAECEQLGRQVKELVTGEAAFGENRVVEWRQAAAGKHASSCGARSRCWSLVRLPHGGAVGACVGAVLLRAGRQEKLQLLAQILTQCLLTLQTACRLLSCPRERTAEGGEAAAAGSD